MRGCSVRYTSNTAGRKNIFLCLVTLMPAFYLKAHFVFSVSYVLCDVLVEFVEPDVSRLAESCPRTCPGPLFFCSKSLLRDVCKQSCHHGNIKTVVLEQL